MLWRMNKHEYDANPEKYHKIAQEDIIVYKIGYDKDGLFTGYESPERYFAGKESYDDCRQRNMFFFPDGTSDMVIAEGHTAYSGECTMELYNDDDDFVGIYTHRDGKVRCYDCKAPQLELKLTCVGEFIIPAGIGYYINDDGEIITSNLIYSGRHILIRGENLCNKMCYSELYKDKPYLLDGKEETIKLKDIKICVG